MTDLAANLVVETATAAIPKNYRRRWRRVLWRTAKAVTQMETSMRCAGIAYFGFLSLFPAISTVVLLIGLLASPGFLADMVDKVDGLIPKVAQQALASQLVTLVSQPRVGLGIGLLISLVVALWSGSRGVAALIYATSQTRQEPERRGLVMTVVVSVLTTLAGATSMVIALALVAGLPAYFSVLPWLAHNQTVLLLIRWPLLLVLGVLAIAAFYRFAPDRRAHRARWIWPGAIVATVLWLAVCALFSLYVESIGNFQATFGSLATAIVLLLWMYNSALILVLGATLNAQLEFETLAERTRTA